MPVYDQRDLQKLQSGTEKSAIGDPLAGVEGLEPPTPGFGDRCSSQLSYTPTAMQRCPAAAGICLTDRRFARMLAPIQAAIHPTAEPAGPGDARFL